MRGVCLVHMKPTNILLALLMVLAFGDVRAEDQPTRRFTGSMTALHTTDDFKYFTTLANYNKRASKDSKLWSYGVEAAVTTGEVVGSEFGFQRFKLIGEVKRDNYLVTLAPGIANRTVDDRSDSQSFDGFAKINSAKKKWVYNLEIGRRVFADEIQSLFSVQENLKGDYYRASVQHRIHDNWKASLWNKAYFLSDDNQRSHTDVAVMYGVSPTWPWIWVGFGYEFMSHTKDNQSYWSPREFYSYGPRLDVSAPIKGKLSFAGGINLNQFRDIDFGQGEGYYLSSKLIYGEYKKTQYALGIELIQSEQNGNIWRSQAGTLGVVCPF